MASKGPRSKLDHETRARKQKALEAPKEPSRPKTHWDHVIEEMVWLSKDFESERKWKLALAKRVAIRASKGMLDHATRGEKKQKEEELRLKKVALNISKDVKKFWTKIEKLVLYKHQLEVDEKKKKALDKQLEFLLGQTERYSTMLAENLVKQPVSSEPVHLQSAGQKEQNSQQKSGDENGINISVELNVEALSDMGDNDEDFDLESEDELEDDEHTIEEDEALITAEERQEELLALKNEVDLPIEELLKRYGMDQWGRERSPELSMDVSKPTESTENGDYFKNNGIHSEVKNKISPDEVVDHRCADSNGILSISENHVSRMKANEMKDLHKSTPNSGKKHTSYDFHDEKEDADFNLDGGEDKDDETTLSEEEELAKAELTKPEDELALLQKESELPLDELLARYKKECYTDDETGDDSESVHQSNSEDTSDALAEEEVEALPDDESTDIEKKADDIQPVADAITEEEGEEKSKYKIADAAAAARSAQPTGNTFLTTKVCTKFPFLLKYPLREYQHIGLDWLVAMYEKRLNGILADEMGLGKTIMTIALLAHLACEKGIWGPHLIVVPTSVMLNWETEFLKWCPAFKILTYFGSAKERRIKRQGWMKPNYFHVCITTYRLVIQDSKIFKRKKWKYLILDEAHLIKNWKSQRWQTLLNFNSKRRILLTGTPLQNDLMELWSLMHFLMPHIFQSHQEFKEWFSNPITVMVEGQETVNKEVVDRLHNVLRPFILRRLKRDVEKQLPGKHEHVISCRLSRRQRNLYEDFIASSETQATLASSNFFGMISVIMQLRKVCNHPDLFEGRPIVSSFDMIGMDVQISSNVCSALAYEPFSVVDLSNFGFLFTHLDFGMTSWESEEVQAIATPSNLIEGRVDLIEPCFKHQKTIHETDIFEEIRNALLEERLREAKKRAASVAWWNSLRCRRKPIYSTTLRDLVTVSHPVYNIERQKGSPWPNSNSNVLSEIVLSPVERLGKMIDQVESFMFAIPAARAPPPVCWCSKRGLSVFLHPTFKERCTELLSPLLTPLRPAIVRRQVYFPDRRLIQFDCGKLQELAVLLRQLKSGGHRALIFTQMTKMLDILEAFINLYGYTYMRLDGSTQPEERQTLMQRFNTNPKIFLFILSTRSGGVGINLVGADTVIFYDSDWNPAMDQQAQDRCHRIGQTREVHIYRLISQSTIEENILKKAGQKRALDDLVIQSGGYNTEFFKKLDPVELFAGHQTEGAKNPQKEKIGCDEGEVSLSNADLEAALKSAEDEADYMALKKVEQEEAVDCQEFTEEAVVRLEDDEYANEDDLKMDEFADADTLATSFREKSSAINRNNDINEERAVTIVTKEDDVDMLADVRQMAAAAAAAGQAITSFENQLRPIDRYAVRFLELWDPIIDKTVVESEVKCEETEWELDRIEKLKEDMEADNDDDDEPFVYERWDTDFATEAYRQQVEALTEQQLLEDIENEAREREREERERELAESRKNAFGTRSKSKSKKKVKKKAKFRSLKKAAQASNAKEVREEMDDEQMYISDAYTTSHDTSSSSELVPLDSISQKKRKGLIGENCEENSMKKFKKARKAIRENASDSSLFNKQIDETKELRSCSSVDHEHKSKSKMGRKVTITCVPVKLIWTIKPEKFSRRRSNVWSGECFPSPDPWVPLEDAMLCALVHEYGTNWSLVSESLYGMTAGGYYRGRYRHPVHCSERFRELVLKYVLSAPDTQNTDKPGSSSSAKSLLKVTEDNVRLLLDVVTEVPDNEMLLQKHFFHLLSAEWRMRFHVDHRHTNITASSSRNGFHNRGRRFTSTVSNIDQTDSSQRMKFTNLSQCASLVASALSEADRVGVNDGLRIMNPWEDVTPPVDKLELTLELQREIGDSLIPLPPVVNVSICAPDPPRFPNMPVGAHDQIRVSSMSMVENHFRSVSTFCVEDPFGWISPAFAFSDLKSTTTSKSGKHKSDTSKSSKSKMQRSAAESSSTQSRFSEVVASSIYFTRPNYYPMARFDFPSNDFAEVAFDGSDLRPPFEIEEVSFNSQAEDVVQHEYDPSFASGLDNYSSFYDLMDIG